MQGVLLEIATRRHHASAMVQYSCWAAGRAHTSRAICPDIGRQVHKRACVKATHEKITANYWAAEQERARMEQEQRHVGRGVRRSRMQPSCNLVSTPEREKSQREMLDVQYRRDCHLCEHQPAEKCTVPKWAGPDVGRVQPSRRCPPVMETSENAGGPIDGGHESVECFHYGQAGLGRYTAHLMSHDERVRDRGRTALQVAGHNRRQLHSHASHGLTRRCAFARWRR